MPPKYNWKEEAAKEYERFTAIYSRIKRKIDDDNNENNTTESIDNLKKNKIEVKTNKLKSKKVNISNEKKENVAKVEIPKIIPVTKNRKFKKEKNKNNNCHSDLFDEKLMKKITPRKRLKNNVHSDEHTEKSLSTNLKNIQEGLKIAKITITNSESDIENIENETKESTNDMSVNKTVPLTMRTKADGILQETRDTSSIKILHRYNQLLIHSCSCNAEACKDFNNTCEEFKLLLNGFCWIINGSNHNNVPYTKPLIRLFSFHTIQCTEKQCKVPFCQEVHRKLPFEAN